MRVDHDDGALRVAKLEEDIGCQRLLQEVADFVERQAHLQEIATAEPKNGHGCLLRSRSGDGNGIAGAKRRASRQRTFTTSRVAFAASVARPCSYRPRTPGRMGMTRLPGRVE